MFESLVSHPFFSSPTFGVIAMLINGSSWCLSGLIMGNAPKRNVDTGIYLGLSSLVNVLISIVPLALSTWECSVRTAALVFVNDIVACFLNYYMMVLMSKAMQIGPNGIIWAIIQSAMIFPFLSGILFFGVKLTLGRGVGIVGLLAGLAMFGLGKDNSIDTNSHSRWRLYTFIAFILCGLQQNMTNLPNYFEAAKSISSYFRVMGCGTGMFLGLAVHKLFFEEHALNGSTLHNSLKNKYLWLYIALTQGISLPLTYSLMYPGMKALGANGLGSISYPLLVGACIVSFTLASIIVLKERLNIIQIVALFSCLTGLALLCL